MRAFLAIPIPQAVASTVSDLALRMREQCVMRASWVPARNYHLTVRFLGDIDPALTVPLSQLSAEICSRVQPFACELNRLGAFPSLDRARVLWVGGDAPDAFRALCSAFSNGLQALGFPKDRLDHRIHVTMARVKGRPDASLPAALSSLSPAPDLRFLAEEVQLMESVLSSRGAVYSPVFTSRFEDAS